MAEVSSKSLPVWWQRWRRTLFHMAIKNEPIKRAKLTNMCHKVFELWRLNSPTSVFVEGTECKGHLEKIYLMLLYHQKRSSIYGPSYFQYLMFNIINIMLFSVIFSHRFFIIGGIHLMAHHVTELRKFYLTRAVCVVLHQKIIHHYHEELKWLGQRQAALKFKIVWNSVDVSKMTMYSS